MSLCRGEVCSSLGIFSLETVVSIEISIFFAYFSFRYVCCGDVNQTFTLTGLYNIH
jgi:hypothetical protein